MSRKDYEAFARVLGEARANHPQAFVALNDVAKSLCEEFHAENPRFDRNRFYAAISVYESARKLWIMRQEDELLRMRQQRGDFSSEKFEVG